MNREKISHKNHVILNFFTIYLGEKNPPLNHTRFWVEAFGPYFTTINVYATHLQKDFKFEAPNLKSVETGGGSFVKRTVAIGRLLWITRNILRSKSKNVCLFHMTTRSLLIMAPILRLFRVPIFLWYSHQARPLSLKLTLPLIDLIFSPTNRTFPINTDKVFATGHGLVLSNRKEEFEIKENQKKGNILVIGRVARVKRIENLLIAASKLPRGNISIECIGPIQDPPYLEQLKELARRNNLVFRHVDAMGKEALNDYMTKRTLVYSGTQGSADKAPLEAVANGCLLISANQDLQTLSGMSTLWWEEFGVHGDELSIEKQLTFLTQRKVSVEARNNLINRCRFNNNLDNLTRTMSTEMLRYA